MFVKFSIENTILCKNQTEAANLMVLLAAFLGLPFNTSKYSEVVRFTKTKINANL